jgi:hypothetical protein
MRFDDLLSLTVPGDAVASDAAALLLIGDRAGALAERMCQAAPGARRPLPSPARVLFGLAILTEPYPVLVGSLMTEHNTQLNQLSLFGWIEDNAILEPRAEILGLTPWGEQPLLFLRDLDLDRPPEAWLAAGQPAAWLRVAGVAIADSHHAGPPLDLAGDEAALSALEIVLPGDAAFLRELRTEVAGGTPLRVALRRRRKAAHPELMRACDGWRVLARAARFIRLNPDPDVDGARQSVEQAVRLNLTRRW